jgi:hypothetical protein
MKRLLSAVGVLALAATLTACNNGEPASCEAVAPASASVVTAGFVPMPVAPRPAPAPRPAAPRFAPSAPKYTPPKPARPAKPHKSSSSPVVIPFFVPWGDDDDPVDACGRELDD